MYLKEPPRLLKKQSKGAHWDEAEKELFVNCFKKYGKNWKQIGIIFPNKTDKQLRNFYQNNKEKLGLSPKSSTDNLIKPNEQVP